MNLQPFHKWLKSEGICTDALATPASGLTGKIGRRTCILEKEQHRANGRGRGVEALRHRDGTEGQRQFACWPLVGWEWGKTELASPAAEDQPAFWAGHSQPVQDPTALPQRRCCGWASLRWAAAQRGLYTKPFLFVWLIVTATSSLPGSLLFFPKWLLMPRMA